jgi:DNA-binding response OmpR family regulator/two-component sensor histidine kinase
LINQLLTFKKIDSETLTLWLEKDNFNETVHKIVTLFSLYAREKEIRIDVLEESSYFFWFDRDKLEKILSNLLSNAIKHSFPEGRIELIVKKITQAQAGALYKPSIDLRATDYIEISVIDNGAGIDKSDWDTIFDRYKQVGSEGKLKPDYSSTGIGLNFTKSLVELHKGKIRMESEMGKATTFAFILPYDSSVYEQRDFSNSTATGDFTVESKAFSVEGEQGSAEAMSRQSDFTKTVLIVEDDPQLNNFLANSLKDIYKVLTAHEGETGLKIVKQQLPDLVISDIMMPKMDGHELTKSIKGNRDICHIPVILLTAKVETSDQIEGLQSGADLYIPKPFNLEYLLAAIDSQLKNRKRIQEMFLNGTMSNLSTMEINQLDLNFLSRLNLILEKELSNTNLEISLIARNLGMSRSGFYRKFIGLTSLSPIAYIRRYRINKSIELMAVGKYSLIEISEMCGFNTQSYFSTAFKQEKNMTPSEYMNFNSQSKIQ